MFHNDKPKKVSQASPKSKKSELLEVRISYPEKRKFMRICQESRTSASEVVRGAVRNFIRDEEGSASRNQGSGLLTGGPGAGALHKPFLISLVASLFAFGALTTLPGLVFSQSAMTKSQLDRLDRNGDRRVSKSELENVMPTGECADFLNALDAGAGPTGQIAFARMDLNGDGMVDGTELDHNMATIIEREFDAQDLNGNGMLSFSEFSRDFQVQEMPPDDAQMMGETIIFGDFETAWSEAGCDETLLFTSGMPVDGMMMPDMAEDPFEIARFVFDQIDGDKNGFISIAEMLNRQ